MSDQGVPGESGADQFFGGRAGLDSVPHYPNPANRPAEVE
jgi:hypothetical protein